MQTIRTTATDLRAAARVFAGLALVCVTGAGLISPQPSAAQERGGRGRDGFARGEERRSRDENRVRFTHSDEGRHFDNGVALRRGTPMQDRRYDRYFPSHYSSYPHYVYNRVPGRSVFSPFGFYVGIFPPYIDRSSVIFAAPRRVFIDVPVYVGGSYRPYADAGDDYYLNRGGDDRWRNDPDLRRAVYDLEDAFRNEDIALLGPLTDPGTNIAVFARGRYEYSLNPGDYLDMTRDFLRNAHTVEFTAYRVRQRTSGVYQVLARHTYSDPNGGPNRTVYLTMVLERLGGRWTLTQVDTSPARLS